MTETEWWQSLEGEDLELNTAGLPPYDAKAVAAYIHKALGDDCDPVLDYGCGTGRLTEEYILTSHLCVEGYDISATALAAAERRLHPFCFTTIATAPFWPCGGAYSVAVLQHLPSEEVLEALKFVAVSLKPGARFVFQFVAGTEDAFLSHQMREADMLVLCERAGLDVEAVAGWLYPQWRWVTAVKP